MNPQDIPQALRDIADMLEQLLGGGGQAQGQAPDIEAMAAAPQGGEQQ